MPGNTTATCVESVRDAFIKTPRWRLVDDTISLDKLGAKDLSEAVTSFSFPIVL